MDLSPKSVGTPETLDPKPCKLNKKVGEKVHHSTYFGRAGIGLQDIEIWGWAGSSQDV